MRILILISVCLGLIFPSSPAADHPFEVTAIEGTAKVQRVQKQKWEKLSVGQKISDNDLVETFFQSRLTLSTEGSVTVIFGSNSKALLNFSVTPDSKDDLPAPNFSLFSGGILTNSAGRRHLSVYTTSAVGEHDSGTMVTVIDEKSGETGLFAISGKVTIRNITKQQGEKLETGYTTIVMPNRDPTPHLYLSVRHVTVLKHFFGDQYITGVLKSSSITPSDNQSAVNRIMASQNTGPEKGTSSALYYKHLFNMGKIYESILRDREVNYPTYRPVEEYLPAAGSRVSLSLGTMIGMADKEVAADYLFMPRFRFALLDATLRFRVANNFHAQTLSGFSSQAGMLDMIKEITIGSVADSQYLRLGTLQDITMGNGLLVSRFRNGDVNSVFNPLGVFGQAMIGNSLNVSAFLADVTTASVGGIYLSPNVSPYHLAVGYYFDRNQYESPSDSTNLRYTSVVLSDSTFPPDSARGPGLSLVEGSLGAYFAESPSFSASVFMESGLKMDGKLIQGYIIRTPSFFFAWPSFTANLSLIYERGTIVSQQFNEFYFSRRSFSRHGGGTAPDTVLTPNTALGKRRSSLGASLGFNANPFKGVDIGVGYRHDFFTKNSHALFHDSLTSKQEDSLKRLSVPSPRDFSLEFHAALDSTVIPGVTYTAVRMRQLHGTLFPATGTYFSSWNTELSFDLVTKPIFQTFSLTGGGRMFHLDYGPNQNDAVDPTDRIWEFHAGITMGFL